MTRGPVAALDCGTNSVRLLILSDTGEPLDRRMAITRLGEGVDATGRLSREAVDRTAAVLAGYRRAMDEAGVVRTRMTATSAARDAANAEAFFEIAERVVGARPELLSGEEEGQISFRGAAAELEAGSTALVADVGGGSTELALGTPPGDPDGVVSVALGCVRLTERYLHHDPPLAGELAAARREVAQRLAEAESALPGLRSASQLVGLAGTVTTLAALELGLVRYDRDRVHHMHLPADRVLEWSDRLAADEAGQRARRPGMEPARVGTIVGGSLIVSELVRRLGYDGLVVSESDILDGLARSILPS
ncbi:MAG: exopolyphosphatase [Acidimicrobiales bacterium]